VTGEIEAQDWRRNRVFAGGGTPDYGVIYTSPVIRVETDAAEGELQLSLTRVTDERGRSIRIDPERNGGLSQGEMKPLSFRLDRYPPSTQRLNFTFAVHRTRTVEFLVKP